MVSRAQSRTPVPFSTIVIDRLPKARLRVGRLRKRSSARLSLLAAVTELEVKRAKKARPRKSSPDADPPLSAATTKNLSKPDKELLKLAQALENAYFQSSPFDSLPANSENARALEDLLTQVRPIADGSIDFTATAPTTSGAGPGMATKKRRGRTPKSSAEQFAEKLGMDVELAPQGSQPSTTAPVSYGKKGSGKRRLNLVSRIALRRKRQELSKKEADASAKVGRGGQDIWSEYAEKLVNKYSSSLDFGVLDWDGLSRDLLSSDEEYSLSLMMRPSKRLEKTFKKLTLLLGQEPSEEEWANAVELDVPTMKRQMEIGKAARNKLIQHNLRLVLFQAHKYQKDTSSLSVFDLCQEGVTGLIHAVDKFDPKRGHRFSTYAVYWVRNSILRAQTRSGNLVRSPYNVAMHKWNIQRAKLDLLMQLERAPTDEEVIDRVGLSPERYRDILRSNVSLRSLHERSLVTGEELVENFPDLEQNDRRRNAGAANLKGMSIVLETLKPKESTVLSQRFGLDGKGERTLREVGKNMNISREMVRRYEACGLLKMKDPQRMEVLRKYLTPEM